jgi:hypothetical protein
MRVSQDQSAPGTNEVDVLVAIYVKQTRALGVINYQRRSADGAERADGTVHSAHKSFLPALEKLL